MKNIDASLSLDFWRHQLVYGKILKCYRADTKFKLIKFRCRQKFYQATFRHQLLILSTFEHLKVYMAAPPSFHFWKRVSILGVAIAKNYGNGIVVSLAVRSWLIRLSPTIQLFWGSRLDLSHFRVLAYDFCSRAITLLLSLSRLVCTTIPPRSSRVSSSIRWRDVLAYLNLQILSILCRTIKSQILHVDLFCAALWRIATSAVLTFSRNWFP